MPGLFWDYTPDVEEVTLHLRDEAFDLVEELDPFMDDGRMTPQRYESMGFLALNTLVSIALLPITDPEDTR